VLEDLILVESTKENEYASTVFIMLSLGSIIGSRGFKNLMEPGVAFFISVGTNHPRDASI